jgi:branched-chain amino acid transport system permease protein
LETFLQQLLNGLVLGSVYALVALGYTMVYGIIGLINFAHGEVVMIGALVALSVMNALLSVAPGMSPILIMLLAVLVAIVTCVALGYGMEKLAYRPLRRAPRLAPLITAIGVSIVLQTSAMMIWGREYQKFPPLFPPQSYSMFGLSISLIDISVLTVSIVMMVGLLVLVHSTRLGRAMRATAENPQVAGLMGVDIDRIISLAFIIGSALAAIAGVLVTAKYSIAHYLMGFMLGLKAFTAAVLGGIGNLAGALVGGLALGIIESLGAGYIGQLTWGVFGSNYQDVFAFLVLVLVLVLRPTGIMGERVAERA